MSKETYIEYRDRVINSISSSFCAAKWYNSTIWLNNGSTTSCHHPPAHSILNDRVTLDDLKKNPSLLHNTTTKKQARKEMLEGKRPSECEYCWKIEDLGKEYSSDRIFKTVIYTEEDIKSCQTVYGSEKDVNLKTLEIAFDSNCNFACSYCNPSFSSAWQNDIKTKGEYIDLKSDGSGAYRQNGDWTKKFNKEENNPYVDAFWNWWPDLSKSLSELRVTGGEATMSPDFWKLVDWWKENQENDIQFAVNSNLGIKDSLLEKLIKSTHYFKKFVLYSSNESTGAHAEYCRDGLIWEEWKNSVEKLLTYGNVEEFHVMMTINSLCLFSMTDFIDYCNTLKRKYGNHYGVCSLNILRFPSFMSLGTLPLSIRLERAEKIEFWLNNLADREVMHEMEVDGIKRLIDYLKEVINPHSSASDLLLRQRDFKNFYVQYDSRRNKEFLSVFPELKDWYNSIDNNLISIKEI